MRIFDTQIDEAASRADRDTGDRHALDQREGIAFHEHAIGERARVALVRIARDVFLAGGLIEHRLPLDAGGKRGAAAAPQSGIRHGAHDLARRHAERRRETGVAALRDVVVETRGIHDAEARAGQTLLAREPGMDREVAEPQGM